MNVFAERRSFCVGRDSPKKEKWGKNNVFTNNVEAPSYMVNLPENGKLKEQIFEGLRPILEEWSGVRLTI